MRKRCGEKEGKERGGQNVVCPVVTRQRTSSSNIMCVLMCIAVSCSRCSVCGSVCGSGCSVLQRMLW